MTLVNTYVLDPSHIAPSRSDANSNGHFPLPTNHYLSNGTPRGFSLQNMAMNVMSFNTNAMANMPNMPPGFAPGMQNNMSTEGNQGHSTGPIRRGGNRFNNRQNPYDRNQRTMSRGYSSNMSGLARNMMDGGQMGFIAQGGGGGGGRWGDGAGGGLNAVGPREAVQGRSIKSYEDLDAAPGGVNGSAAGAGAAANATAGAELDY